ncbi:MAG: DUF4276 family protein [Marinospirillum sp.]|uniref:DUF4276 family protein n=1 Tax=Marinospirillum sp. TaxID=2183934 RepID=UPI0019F44ED4|nr:DUF4276 family protein [Marinospirillum sp.]MBE0507678.1 DUF4276 family protein [Marinospirillum sp.]
MIRVHVICEGQTEEQFVNELLQPVFMDKGLWLLPALVGKPGHKGGKFKFERLRTDVENRLLKERTAYCTTFFDFYGLPEDFPGKPGLDANLDIAQKAMTIKSEMTATLTCHLGQDAMRRFIPYIQMYEFEALLFSNPEAFASGVDRPHLTEELRSIASDFETPERINNDPNTAPSKRIEKLIPGYEKPLLGSLAALEMGLPVIREKCRLFDAWLCELEAIPTE